MKHSISFDKSELEDMVDILDMVVMRWTEQSLAQADQRKVSARRAKNLRRKFQVRIDLDNLKRAEAAPSV